MQFWTLFGQKLLMTTQSLGWLRISVGVSLGQKYLSKLIEVDTSKPTKD